MTALPKSGIHAGGPVPGRQFSVSLAAALALLAGVVLAAHALVAPAPAVVDPVPRAPAAVSAAPQPQPASGRSRAEEAHVEALVDAASRKYRVSTEAMRELVDSAYAEARRNRLDPLLILAVMAVESRFNPIAESNFGATGLMQVIPRYHADKFSAARGESVLDPQINIRVGARALKEYVIRGGNEAAGLQLYNGAASDPNRSYAAKVLAERARLRDVLRKTQTVALRAAA